MKLAEIDQPDAEFANQELTNDKIRLRHLYNVQKARVHELVTFLHRLARRYPNWWEHQAVWRTEHNVQRYMTGKIFAPGYNPAYWHNAKSNDIVAFDTFLKLTKTQGYPGDLVGRQPLPVQIPKSDADRIRHTFIDKFTAMLRAKRAYEAAGGDYDTYFLHHELGFSPDKNTAGL